MVTPEQASLVFLRRKPHHHWALLAGNDPYHHHFLPHLMMQKTLMTGLQVQDISKEKKKSQNYE